MLKFGSSLFFTEHAMKPAELGRELEKRGFESVWSGEHSHIPVVLKTPCPGEGGVKRYWTHPGHYPTVRATRHVKTPQMGGRDAGIG